MWGKGRKGGKAKQKYAGKRQGEGEENPGVIYFIQDLFLISVKI